MLKITIQCSRVTYFPVHQHS